MGGAERGNKGKEGGTNDNFFLSTYRPNSLPSFFSPSVHFPPPGILAIFFDGFTRLAASSSSPSSSPSSLSSSPTTSFLAARGIHLLQPQTLLLFFGPTAFLFVVHYCALAERRKGRREGGAGLTICACACLLPAGSH